MNKNISSIPPQEFKIFYLFRRIAIYIIIGSIIINAFGIYMRYYATNQIQFENAVQGSLLFFIAAIAYIWLAHIKLRINNQGIAIRYLLKWNYWYWEDFKSGKIGRGFNSGTFKRPSAGVFAKWFPSSLRLDIFGPQVMEYVLTIIFSIWVPPPTPQLPEKVFFKTKDFFSKKILLSPEGIYYQKRNKKQFYHWSEVKKIEIVKADHYRVDFRKLTIYLPNNTVKLNIITRKGMKIKNYENSTNEIIYLSIMQFAPKDKVIEIVQNGPPKSIHEIEYRKANVISQYSEFQKSHRFAPVFLSMFLILLFALPDSPFMKSVKFFSEKHFVFSKDDIPFLMASSFFLLFPLIYIIIFIFIYKDKKQRFSETLKVCDKWQQEMQKGLPLSPPFWK